MVAPKTFSFHLESMSLKKKEKEKKDFGTCLYI